jgi:hypothetical protein
VKAVAVFENERCDYDGEECKHRRRKQPATNTSARPQG